MWLVVGMFLGSAVAKPPAEGAVTGEVKSAYAGFAAKAEQYRAALRTVDVPGVQDAIHTLPMEKAAPFQARLDPLSARLTKAEDALKAAESGVARASATNDTAAITSLGDTLVAAIPSLAPLAAEVEALRAEVVAGPAVPSTLTAAGLATFDLTTLPAVFASRGWLHDGAPPRPLTLGGYETVNFDLALSGAALNVAVTRPGRGLKGYGSVPPKELATKAVAEGKAHRYDAAADTYVEITPRAGGTADQAATLLAAVFSP